MSIGNDVDPWAPSPQAIAKAEQQKRGPSVAPTPPAHSETSSLSRARKEEEEREKREKEERQREERQRAAAVAYNGRPVDLNRIPSAHMPPFPGDQDPNFQYFPEAEIDYSDLSVLNRDINRARYRLFRANAALKEAQRKEAEAEFEYRRAHARVMAGLSGGSEKQRQAIADLKVEQEWADWMVAKQVAKEYESLLRQLRVDLDSLAGISHNVRAQINIM